MTCSSKVSMFNAIVSRLELLRDRGLVIGLSRQVMLSDIVDDPVIALYGVNAQRAAQMALDTILPDDDEWVERCDAYRAVRFSGARRFNAILQGGTDL